MKDIPEDIIALAAGGDMAAFETIYKEASGFVYNVALRITSNHENAQEATQDVFVKAYRNLHTFGFRSSLKTWLYRIATNTAINIYRRTSKERKRRGDYETAICTASSPGSPDSGIEKKESGDLLNSMMSGMNPDQRACLVLREIEGLSYAEISDLLHINVNTVRSRLKRAREALMALGKSEVIQYEL